MNPHPPADETRYFKTKTRLEIAKLALWILLHNAWEAIRTFNR